MHVITKMKAMLHVSDHKMLSACSHFHSLCLVFSHQHQHPVVSGPQWGGHSDLLCKEQWPHPARHTHSRMSDIHHITTVQPQLSEPWLSYFTHVQHYICNNKSLWVYTCKYLCMYSTRQKKFPFSYCTTVTSVAYFGCTSTIATYRSSN